MPGRRVAGPTERPVTVAGLVAQIARYDSQEARAVSLRIRETASLSACVLTLEAIYREKYIPGFELYCREVAPRGRASDVVTM